MGTASELRLEIPSVFQTASTFKLLVKAYDQGTPQLSSTATVNVAIEDANNHPPVFTRDNVRKNIITLFSLPKYSSVLQDECLMHSTVEMGTLRLFTGSGQSTCKCTLCNGIVLEEIPL